MQAVKKEATVKKRTPPNRYVEKRVKPSVNAFVDVNLHRVPNASFAVKTLPRDARK
jgi:hypothetical protein